MPAQTTIKSYVYIPDGCKVQVKDSDDVAYTDLGVVMGAVTASLTWTEAKLEYANAEEDIKIKDMLIDGAFTLGNLNPDNIVKLSNGIITSATTAASENSSIPVQTIAAGWDDQIKYELVMETSSTDDTKLKMATAPSLTSVVLDPDSAAESLTAWSASASGDYTIVADSDSYSGWSIIFNSASMATGTPKTKTIAITYAANTPVATTTLKCGTAAYTAVAYSLKFTHTDSDSLVRQLELFSVFTKSGGIQFNFKPVSDTGIEEMPVTFQAKIDTTRTDGDQLFEWTVNNGAD
ncbi:MAG: hypothetical protein PHE51_04935 [Eubacteriales bacterium]|nr:hypothetical protein [Eubacteriales bacterium]